MAGQNTKRHYKKRKNKQPYIVGGLMIIFTLLAALVLVYFSSGAKPVSTEATTSVASNITSIEETSSETLDEDVKASTDEPVSQAKTTPKYPSISGGGEYALTDEEVAEIEAIIVKAENEVYYTPGESSELTADQAVSSEVSSTDNKTTSSKALKPPPERRSISIYFEDIQSGYSYSYNADKKYFIASLIKAPYCMYLYNLAEKGECDLSEKVTVEYKDLKEGTGNIRKKKPEEFPFTMTVRELMSEAIRSSDNTAMEKLRKKYPHTGYLPYVKSLGINYPDDVLQMVNGKITAIDAGVYAKAIYNYIQTGKYGKDLYDDMTNTSNRLIASDYVVARKYGWAELSLHDMAIVYAKSPYTLSICTDATIGKKSDYQLFYDLSKAFEKFHNKRYP